MKLTDWHPPSIKPVHVGWYHTGINNYLPIYAKHESTYNWWWNGSEWGFYHKGDWINSIAQDRYWRGIAKD